MSAAIVLPPATATVAFEGRFMKPGSPGDDGSFFTRDGRFAGLGGGSCPGGGGGAGGAGTGAALAALYLAPHSTQNFAPDSFFVLHSLQKLIRAAGGSLLASSGRAR